MQIKSILISVFTTLLLSQSVFSQTYKWDHVAIGGGGFVDGIIISKTNPKVMFARTDVGGAYRWDSINTKWVQMLDWVSIDQTGYLGVESMAIDPQNNNTVYLYVGTSYFNSGNSAILKSTDGGKTFSIIDVSNQFKAHGNGMGRQNGERLAVDPNLSTTLYCGTRWNGLFMSINSGTTWKNISTIGNSTANGNGICFVVVDPNSSTNGKQSKTIIFGVSQTGTNMYMSTDTGNTFNAMSGQPTNLMPQRATLASDSTLYITYADKEGPWNPGSGAIWKYSLKTGNWTNITPSGITSPFGGISVDPANPLRIIASTCNVYNNQYTYNGNNVWGDYFYLSTDGGKTWTALVSSANPTKPITLDANGCTWIPGYSLHWCGDIQFNPKNTAQAFVISGNGMFQCDNVNASSMTWKFDAIGIEEVVPLDIASIPGGPLFSVIGDYDGFKHTSMTAFAPVYNPAMGTSTGFAYAPLNTSYLVRVGASMYYSTDQGSTWTKTSAINGTKGRVAASYNTTTKVYTILHCPEGSSTTYRSINNGGSWSSCNGLNILNAVPVADPVNSSKYYAYNSSDGKMYVSTDAGANFSASGSPGTGAGNSQIIRTIPGREGHIWVAVGTGGLMYSTNSGSSFTKLSTVSNCTAVGFGKMASGASYETIFIWGTVNSVTGIFRSIDQGATWTRINDEDHEFGGPGNGQFVIGDWNTYGRVYMSSVGVGIVYGDVSTTTTPTVTISTTANSNTICSGYSTIITATTTVTGGTISKVEFYDGTSLLGTATTSPYSYNWTNAAVGTHTVTTKATDNTNAVTTSAAISITVNALPNISAGADVTICSGKTTTLTATGGTAYIWSNAIATATNAVKPTTSTTYTVTGSNAANCSATDAVIVTLNALPTISAGADATICLGKTTTLTATGGTAYIWNNTITTATNSVNPATTTTYTVTGSNAANCSATDAVIVTVNALPTINAGADATICSGKATTLTATGGTTYIWSNAITTASNSVNPTITTTYTVTGSNAANCSATDAVIVTVNALPTINAGADISICSGTSVTISVIGGISYYWSTGATTSSITVSPTSTTSYIVTGTNTLNCMSTDNIKITVNDIPTAPTVATPINYSLNETASVLTANGLNLLWYNNNTGGTALSAATVPITTATGTSNYYVSQTVNNCESLRSQIAVIVSNLQQTIQLETGWNLISFYVQPSDSSISSVFGGLGTNLETVKTQDAFYDPTQAVFQNSLKSIVRGQAYFVKVKSNSALTISGGLVGSLKIGLKTGWNLIGYPKQNNSDIASATSSIISNINSIKNFNGFYIPTGSTNSITTFESGKGYFINCSGGTNLSW